MILLSIINHSFMHQPFNVFLGGVSRIPFHTREETASQRGIIRSSDERAQHFWQAVLRLEEGSQWSQISTETLTGIPIIETAHIPKRRSLLVAAHSSGQKTKRAVSYTHLRAHET